MDVIVKRLPVVEIFGPTIQGEGPQVGMLCAFVRMGGCDYRCAWCDSAHAVLPEEVRFAKRMTEEEIVRHVRRYHVPLVVLSGGNPLLHDLTNTVAWLHDAGFRVAVETQGTLFKNWINNVDQVVVSPKPPSSDMDLDLRAFQMWRERVTAPLTIKVPCFDLRDVTFADMVAGVFPRDDMFLSVVTLMGGLYGTFEGGRVDTSDDILQRYVRVIEWAQNMPNLRTARILPQLHALAWGHERGH